MDNHPCSVKVVTRDKRTVCAITVDVGEKVDRVKLKIQEQSMRRASSFVLYYNKIYLMNDTVLRDLHPSSDSFSLIIEYGVDREYTFVLDDGSTRRARVNSLETFGGIRDLAASTIGTSANNVIVLCNDMVPISPATPSSYNVTSRCFRVTMVPNDIPPCAKPSIVSTIKALKESNDPLLCYLSLVYFFNNDPNNYVSLIDLALITCDALADVNAYIPSKMDICLLFLIHTMIYERISIEAMQAAQTQPRDNSFLFLETLYNCLHVLVVRYLKLSLPLARDVLRYLLQPIELYQKTLGASSVRMSMLRSSYTSTKTPPACSAVMELCVSALELYCNAG
ncbi:hypothetical protein WA556_003841, partial [Blastocystis sp. ATCC 50177/Nand II]